MNYLSVYLLNFTLLSCLLFVCLSVHDRAFLNYVLIKIFTCIFYIFFVPYNKKKILQKIEMCSLILILAQTKGC